jgi:uncharacterized membrane protein YfcA
MDLLLVVLAAAAVFTVASATAAVSGFGLALVAVPVIALLVDPAAAVVGTNILAMGLAAGVVRRERRHVEGWAVRRFALIGVLGIPLGLAALRLLSANRLTLLMAVVLLVFVALLAAGVQLPAGRGAQWVAGVTSGFLLASTGMNGPPLVVILQAMGMSPRRFRASLQGVFFVQAALVVLGLVIIGGIDRTALLVVLGGAIGIPLGWRVGDRWFHALSPEVFRRVVLAVLALTAVTAAVSALTCSGPHLAGRLLTVRNVFRRMDLWLPSSNVVSGPRSCLATVRRSSGLLNTVRSRSPAGTANR